MLARLADLFVERVELPSRPKLSAAGKLLVVDATPGQLADGPLFARVAEDLPLTVDVVALGRFNADQCLPDDHDELWLLVDAGSDLAYCQLLCGDLQDAGRRRAELVAVGQLEHLPAAHRLELRHLGRGSRWRRHRDLAEGTQVVRELFAGRRPRVVA